MKTNQVSHAVSELLVKKCSRELSGLCDIYLPQSSYRVTPVWKVGRKRRTLDIEKTKSNAIRYLNRFSIIVDIKVTDNQILTSSIVLVNNQLTLLSGALTFFNAQGAPLFEYEVVVSRLVIKKHALARWLFRNNTDDYKHGLRVLGSSLLNEAGRLDEKTLMDAKVLVGVCERQIETSDGGVAFVVMTHSDEVGLLNTNSSWDLVTYISKNERANWNNTQINSEYDNLEDVDLEVYQWIADVSPMITA